ncbi:uncharacterized protein LOC135948964 [Calliphora vicina]|uniref:uncharacterized protein LOC135948964 n=1 Tax=Calliphora vicina TaxID=7373 RepID=UPI00325BED7F
MNHLDLNNQLTIFWELEEVQEKPTISTEDVFCENLYKNTTFRENGRFVVVLPVKSEYTDNIPLGNSRNSALTQFLRNESRLKRNPQLKHDYDKVIEEYSLLNHMITVIPDLSAPPNSSFYLPHHSVLKPESTTTKLRVVFNASSSTSSGLSLNDVLHPGTVLQQDLTVLITRWRLFKYIFNADIEKMYRQILPLRENVTKRTVLSDIARLFDPAGWLAPKIVVAKMIMQQIWKDQIEWDENLKPETMRSWLLLISKLISSF